MPRIGLSMIVKDEAHVIARCLDSFRSLIDAAVIVDTGSTDGTQRLLRDYFARHGLAGEVIEEPWRNFADNRTSALAALRRRRDIDYAMVMDADDFLAFEAGFDAARFKAGLDADIYDLDIHHGGTVYRRPQLFRNALAFRYRSVLHEYLEGPPGDLRRGHAAGLHIVYGADGGRSRDPDKYRKDAALLERALEGETDPFLRARYTFYLAQSYRDSGQRRPAIDTYLRRADLGYWDQEVYESLLNAGKMMAEEGATTEAVLAILDRATAAVPERAEAAQSAARICRERGEHRRGIEIAERSVSLPLPSSGLFLQPWVYETGLLDEYAVNASWTGRDMDALVAWSIVLGRPGLDEGTRDRLRSNRDFVYDRLAAQNSLWVTTLGEDRAPRIAVVTPYYKESPETLRRCVESVKRQTVKADHIVVADGHAQAWLDGEVTRHVRLDRGSADYGNTPRTIGGLLAASSRYTAICLLDADCWFDDDHVERCLTAALSKGMDRCRIVTGFRKLLRLDLTLTDLADEDPDHFVDTNCYFLLPPAFGLFATWSMMPRALDWIGDRMFFLFAKTGGHLSARTRSKTVNYVTPYEVHYRALGEEPPPGCKGLPDHARYRAWVDALPPQALDVLRHQLGADIRGLYHSEYLQTSAPSSVRSASVADGLRNGPSSPSIVEARTLFAKGRLIQAEKRLLEGGFTEETKAHYAITLCDLTRARQSSVRPALLWRCEGEKIFEGDWIAEMLAGVPYDDIGRNEDAAGKHLIVCDNRLTPAKRAFYVDRAASGCRIHLIHLSDEWADDDTAVYDVCASVLRNQWSPAYDMLKHVVSFPLGYKSGFQVASAARAKVDRPLLWSFAGHTRSDARQAMLAALGPLGPNRTHLSSGFDAADGLSQNDYRRQLEQSLFAPCPSGFSTPDTFRFCEALEAGCIPIVERGAEYDYYRSWLGQHPILVVDDWSQGPDLIRRVVTSNQAENVRQSCGVWYDGVKKSFQAIFAKRIGYVNPAQ